VRGLVKSLLPDRQVRLPVLRGPFRGASLYLNPRNSFRQVLGVYEHELNGWLEAVLPLVDTVIDVGANEGYFTFGCAAAFRRLNKTGEIVAFEPDDGAFETLKTCLENQPKSIAFSLQKTSVGAIVNERTTTLNEFLKTEGNKRRPERTLIKIDVEGAELDVIGGASRWLTPTNYFLIEVHWDPSFLDKLNATFEAQGLKLCQIDQRALPLLGYENRGREQWWLVSDVSHNG
jgi:hypothetical protein